METLLRILDKEERRLTLCKLSKPIKVYTLLNLDLLHIMITLSAIGCPQNEVIVTFIE